MSLGEPLTPQSVTPQLEEPDGSPDEQPDEQPDAPVQDSSGEPGETGAPTTGAGEAVNDEDLPLPNRPPNEPLSSDDLNGEAPD